MCHVRRVAQLLLLLLLLLLLVASPTWRCAPTVGVIWQAGM
jgi:hypothetical protein